MAPKTRIALLCMLRIVSRRADATPTVAFPFNSQVPTAARVGEEYTYQFSASTFAPEGTNFTYSLSGQPEWLSIDSATRTLSGAPSEADAGASSFTLTAADNTGAAHMPCTLLVSTDPPPQLDWDIGQQLAESTNLSSTQPPVVAVLPAHDFQFDFRQDSFIDIVQRKLTYYAILADHTPLPAWLLFDDKELVFSGIAPQLSSFPQSWDVALIASDIEGFAGAAATFTISIATQKLVFVPEKFQVNITAGTSVDFTALQDAIFLNGDKISPESLEIVQAIPPAWLVLDKTTLALTGTVPVGTGPESFTITVIDTLGNQAAAVINLATGHTSLFTSHVGTLTAYSGQLLEYTFPNSLFSSRDVELTVTLPGDARWLSFDASTRTLTGKVPDTSSPSEIDATITAKTLDTTTKESEAFKIIIETPSTNPSSSRPSHLSSTHTTLTTTPTTVEVQRKDHPELSKGAIVAIVIAPLILLSLLAALLVFCWRRRKRHEGYVDASSPAKRTISRPILPSEVDTITVTTEVQTDVEKQAGLVPERRESRSIIHAPQLSLGLPKHNSSRKSKKSMRFSNMSHASSIGNAEDTIRTDSNIPEWGRESAALQTPHDSFSVPTAIARSSRQASDLSPSKPALRRLREKRDSRRSVGLGIDIDGGSVFPRHSSRGARGHRKVFNSLGHSTIPDRSSATSFSTRGTSVLSTRPSDFPRPPTRSTFGGIRSVAALSLSDAEKRRSIRLVGRSDSIPDERSMHEKRQSFIRNRASTTLDSPLFAHGSRAAMTKKSNGNSSANVSSNSSQRRSRVGRSVATTYSESSSLEPSPRDSRRLSTRIRSAFAPNFPRAITRSTLDCPSEKQESDSWSTFYSDSGEDLAAQLALPRHERNFVVPGEASPTPPPAPPASAQALGTRSFTPAGERGKTRQKWKERPREHSSSPLSTAVAVPVSEGNSPRLSTQPVGAKKNRLSEPLALVSNDSLSRGKLERPRLVQTKSNRPVSVEKVQRLSSLKAETEDARPGSEMWEAMEGAGLMPPNSSEATDGTQRSNMSGPAFL